MTFHVVFFHKCFSDIRERKEKRKSWKNQKAIPRLFQQVLIDSGMRCWVAKEKKLFKKWKKMKNTWDKEPRFLSRNCHKSSTLNTIADYQSDWQFFFRNSSGILREISRDPYSHLAFWLFQVTHARAHTQLL